MDVKMKLTNRVEYSSNNSGGHWWLSDEDWVALEEAGWEVEWCKDSPYWGDKVDEDGRWLGTLAHGATKRNTNLKIAIAEWETITGQDAHEEGCSCCGEPHSFVEYDEDDKWINSSF